jgi:hypothetical protein
MRTATSTQAVDDVITHLQNEDGLTIAGIAYARNITAVERQRDFNDTSYELTSGARLTFATSVLIDGPNSAGYARFIIVRGKFMDPTTGSVSVSPYGGAVNNSAVSTAIVSGTTQIKSGKLINLSRQTQLIFRVITREYDSTSLVRPDNL